jgi:hypothetical protein
VGGLVTVVTNPASGNSGSATCGSGLTLIGGGFSDLGGVNVNSSFPNGDSWTVQLNSTVASWVVYAICAA